MPAIPAVMLVGEELSGNDDFDCIGPDPAGHTGRRGGDSHWLRGRRLETGECSMCQYRPLNIIYNYASGFFKYLIITIMSFCNIFYL